MIFNIYKKKYCVMFITHIITAYDKNWKIMQSVVISLQLLMDKMCGLNEWRECEVTILFM
jgi:hypothetical protein